MTFQKGNKSWNTGRTKEKMTETELAQLRAKGFKKGNEVWKQTAWAKRRELEAEPKEVSIISKIANFFFG